MLTCFVYWIGLICWEDSEQGKYTIGWIRKQHKRIAIGFVR